MSWWISLKDPITGEILHAKEKHQLFGTTEMSLNVTYNYSTILDIVKCHPDRALQGNRARDTAPVILGAILILDRDATSVGNVRRALCDLLWMALAEPNGVWEVS